MYFLFKRESNGKPSKQFKNTKIPYVPSRVFVRASRARSQCFPACMKCKYNFISLHIFLVRKRACAYGIAARFKPSVVSTSRDFHCFGFERQGFRDIYKAQNILLQTCRVCLFTIHAVLT